MPPLVVMGIDPGSRNMGWGVVSEQSGVLRLVDCGVLRPAVGLAKNDNGDEAGGDFSARLGRLFIDLSALIARFDPAEAAVETVFTNKNILSALKLGQARGVAVAACAANGVPVTDYEPTQIKKTLVGAGRAEKSQVAYMVRQILGVKADWPADASDALACAVCHLNMRRMKRMMKVGGVTSMG